MNTIQYLVSEVCDGLSSVPVRCGRLAQAEEGQDITYLAGSVGVGVVFWYWVLEYKLSESTPWLGTCFSHTNPSNSPPPDNPTGT